MDDTSNNITEWMRQLAASERKNRYAENEIGCLKKTISSLQNERDEMGEKLSRLEALAEIGVVASGVAHDFNNLLYGITGFASLALENASAQTPLAIQLNNILSASERASTMVKHILEVARQAKKCDAQVSVLDIIKEISRFTKSIVPENVCVNLSIDENTPCIKGDATAIHRLVLNLITNAIQAMDDDGGELKIILEETFLQNHQTCKTHTLLKGKCVRIIIEDTGIGMSLETLKNMFEPYFTTKALTGSGMGLLGAHDAVCLHGGIIDVKSTEKVGTKIEILLPALDVYKKPKLKIAEQNDKPLAVEGTERILFVDDEALLVQLGVTVLKKLGYRVTGMINSLDAAMLFESDPTAFDIVITDFVMPQLSGFELIDRIHSACADCPVIICTGHKEGVTDSKCDGRKIEKILRKPLNVQVDLPLAIRAVFESKKKPVK